MKKLSETREANSAKTAKRSSGAGASGVRIDKYLWAVRIFKTRSDAAEAVRSNRVTLNSSSAKPSREVAAGDVITVRRTIITRRYRVVELVSSRQGAKDVVRYCEETTPQSELDRLNIPHETLFVFRERGTGRPTKKERRDMDSMMAGISLGTPTPADDWDDEEDSDLYGNNGENEI